MKRGLPRPNINQAFARDRVNLPGQVGTIYQPLYDYQTVLAAGATSVTFFQTPIGQGGKTLTDTNMDLAGQLPKGQSFQITGVQVEILPILQVDNAAVTDFADDVYAIANTGLLILKIGSKDFITQGNLMKFPPVNRLAGFASTGLVTQQIQYATHAGREYSVANLLLESSQNFSVELRDIAATPSTANVRIGVTLNGYLFRNAQ